MAINLQSMNVLPPNVPSNRGRISNNPSFGFRRDDAEDFRVHKEAMEEIANDKSNPLSKIAKVMAVLGGVAITAISTKVMLKTSLDALSESQMLKNYSKKSSEVFKQTKSAIVNYSKKVKASKIAKRITENTQLIKAQIQSTSIGKWIFNKIDTVKNSQIVQSFKRLVKEFFKSVFGSFNKEHVSTGAGALAGTSVIAKQITKEPVDDGGDE